MGTSRLVFASLVSCLIVAPYAGASWRGTLLHPIRHRDGSAQADRALLRSRDALVTCNPTCFPRVVFERTVSPVASHVFLAKREVTFALYTRK